MKKCPGCGRLFHDDVDKCTVDGQALIAVSAGERAEVLKRRDNPRPSYSARRDGQSIAHRHFTIGTLWLVGGIAVTAFTYSAASSGPGGGTYVVAWGAMLVGVTRLIRGFVAASQSRGPSSANNFISTVRPAAPAEKPVWTCPKCGEQSLPQTTACWKCGEQRTATP